MTTSPDRKDETLTVLDLFMGALITRPERIAWSQPHTLYPLLRDCAEAFERHGYTTHVGVVRGVAYLTARRLDTPT